MFHFKAALISSFVLIGACQSTTSLPPITTAEFVDLDRFSGDWHVIANIPTFIETQAYNAVENYQKPVNGKIATTFTFNKGAFDGPRKVYRPTGFIKNNTGNAVWGMQFVWPIKAEYRIVYIDDDYQYTIIGRTKRDYVWLMARQPVIPDADYQKLSQIIEDEGYDLAKLRKVPQQANRQ
nr:putative outer membrane lipoprotein [uncultured bacterium]